MSIDRSNQNAYLAALHDTGLALLSRRDRDELLRVIVERACTLLGTPMGYLALVEQDKSALTAIVRVGVDAPRARRPYKWGEGVAGTIWQTGEPLVVNDYHHWPGRLRGGEREWARAVAGVPLVAQGEVIGVLSCVHTELGKRFDPTDMEVLTRFGQLAAIALDNARVHKELREELDARVAAEEGLRASEARNGAILAATLDCIITIDRAGRIVEFNRAAERTFGYQRADAIGKRMADLLVPPSQRAAHDEGFLRHLETGERRILGGRVEMTAMRADGSTFPAELAVDRVPLDGPPLFTASLRDITERRRGERRDAAFSALGQRLSATTTTVDAARVIADVADDLLGWDAFAIYLYTPDDDTLQTVLNMDEVDGRRAEVPPAGDARRPVPVIRRAMTEGGQLILRDGPPAPDEGLIPFGDTGRRSASLMFVPVRRGSEAIGFLTIQSYTPEAYTADDLATLQVLADHCGGALERARAEDALRRQNAYLAALHETSIGLLRRLDRDDVLEAILARASTLLGTPHGYIDLVRPDGQALEAAVALGAYRVIPPYAVRAGEGMSGQVWQTGRPVAVDDYAAWPGRIAGQGYEAFASAVSVPLTAGAEVVGVLGLARTDTGRPFAADEVETLARFADLASIALDNARLLGETRRELAERKLMEQGLVHNAMHDPLTGLPNRALLADRLERALKRARRDEGHRFTLLYLDLDRFKVFNDSLGHQFGDDLLVEVARRLATCVREGDTLARRGGDEFILLLEGVADGAAAVAAALRVREALSASITVHNRKLFVGASIGIALGPAAYRHPEDMLRDADTAMYRAKAEGGGGHAIFDAALRARAVARLQMEGDLRRAIEGREFVLRYQPVVTLATGALTGFEALVRWMRPGGGLALPEQFISLAEETGLIVPIDRWVLRAACVQMGRWAARYPAARHLTLGVNISPRDLVEPDFATQVLATLGEAGMEPRQLILEVTEGTLVERAGTAATVLGALHAAGVRIHLDDFGVGYSSLSYLKRFPVAGLKIDRSFVRGEGDTGGEAVADAEIVRAIVALAHSLGIGATAEGVETERQRAELVALACDHGQGHLFSPPIDAARAGQLIARQSERRTDAGVATPAVGGGTRRGQPHTE